MGVSYLVEATDIFFTFGGFPRFVEVGETVKKNCLARPSEKICPNCMLLGTSYEIWGRFGVILEILECRITVCYKTFCQIRKRLNGLD